MVVHTSTTKRKHEKPTPQINVLQKNNLFHKIMPWLVENNFVTVEFSALLV